MTQKKMIIASCMALLLLGVPAYFSLQHIQTEQLTNLQQQVTKLRQEQIASASHSQAWHALKQKLGDAALDKLLLVPERLQLMQQSQQLAKDHGLQNFAFIMEPEQSTQLGDNTALVLHQTVITMHAEADDDVLAYEFITDLLKQLPVFVQLTQMKLSHDGEQTQQSLTMEIVVTLQWLSSNTALTAAEKS